MKRKCLPIIISLLFSVCGLSEEQPHAIPSVSHHRIEDKGNSCGAFLRSQKVREILAQLNRIESSNVRLWPDYHPESLPVVLVSSDHFDQCALLIKEGKVGQFTLPKPVPAQGYFLACSILDKRPERGCEEIQNHVLSQTVPASLVLNVDIDDTFEKKGLPEYARMLFYGKALAPQIIVHENFHLFVNASKQFQPDLNPKWPDWASHDVRGEIIAKCYPFALNLGDSKQIQMQQTFIQEKLAIQSAIRLALVEHDRDHAIAAAKDFIKLRRQRYDALADVRISKAVGDPDTLSCEEAEANMEMLEGMNDYIGFQTMLLTNDISPAQVANWISMGSETSGISGFGEFYRFGLAEMLLLRKLYPDQIDSIAERLSKSSTPQEGIFGEFRKILMP